MESENTQTTLLVLSSAHPIFLMNLNAPDITEPDDPPTNKPSLLMSLLAFKNDS